MDISLDVYMEYEGIEQIDWFCGMPFGIELYMESLFYDFD